MSCNSKCFVALPHGVVGWSTVFCCGIYYSYSLTFWFPPHINVFSCWLWLLLHSILVLINSVLIFMLLCRFVIYMLSVFTVFML